MNIFITGASGFVGEAATRILSKKHTVKAMSRSEKADAIISMVGGKPVRCELNSVDSNSLKGIDVVIHSAAYVEQWGPFQDFWKVNVDGTAQLLEASRKAGVKRFIFIGTEAALFYGQPMIDIDESYPYPKNSPFPYSKTKAEAEKLVLKANSSEMQTISIRPRFIWGPGDKTVLPVLLKMIADGNFSWIDGGKALTNTTHIYNLIHSIELALTKGQGGKAYFVTDDEVFNFRNFLESLLATQKVAAPNRSIPGWLARFLARILERVWKLFRIKNEPPLTRFSASIMSRDCTIKIDNAKKDLGYSPLLTVRQGLAEMPVLGS
ncbi:MULTISPECIES: NAD-dependent epimerase/dehydratase family protein [Leptospira]|uniref:3-beta hydroxysteroid dehydrogenase/isomerase family protein n=3 Tax=Leptospira weilii TaxID=28184 RepID=A0A828YYN9_9LEPT|nr:MULTISPECIES: NAD-dependent epimerase/dehydratase family protein [Leptospira]EMY14785.1 3-beta hydroxysteroid dehydrogenase/isomerase family protein [Leptospira weilii str. Ecochallenge]EKR63292.1 3-beta hydroxysteroid dehydrogenase/isomerase family protein [Leptospira weilii str. 2006001853]EKR63338.1 3-beta hydroxysteroid dehydrogenase/isomerase family protein [Leptospira weilii str. 2006001853]EMJ60221.1 3-beta hydroxysteroid dehydrogenase/isomerase family protein [Leptospira sp. P2653]E